LIARIDRILVLAERWLEGRTGARLEPALAARCTAFRWDARDGAGRLLPIEEMQAVDLDDLLGVERSIAELVRNTAQFVRGLPANHVLLFGERGTGKSSSVGLPRASRGLRLVEVRKNGLVQPPMNRRCTAPVSLPHLLRRPPSTTANPACAS
jgi:predicted AAA+ superfamily ATPase